MKNIKIAILLDGLNHGDNTGRGATSYAVNFIENLTKNFQVDLYCKSSDLDKFFDINVIKLEDINVTSSFFEDKGYSFVWDWTESFFKSDEYKTFFLRHSHSKIYREFVVRTPFEMFFKKIFSRSRLMNKERIEEVQEEFNDYNFLIANSSIAKRDFVNYCKMPFENVDVLYPCLKEFKPYKKAENKTFTFGMSATTFALKGGYTFLEALHKLNKTHKDFKAKIIYPNHKKTPFFKILLFLLGLQNKVEFLDFQPDMSDFYTSIDCLVCPSREETFGLVILEAMASGRPVIASSRCGAVDIIAHNANSWIFDYETKPVKNLSETMKEVLACNNLDEISEFAYLTAKNFNMERHSEDLKKILTSHLKQESLV
ncbi:MAG: glycosyltransferase family 4 protein [Candidatus Gastranaerophilales bacterium]|nr:glycosyltransferase family 4 protein [Candidatus Gastranaerophilales bacterium]